MARNKSWYEIVSKAPDNATVMIYGEIGKGGVRAADFVQELAQISASTLNIRMHSPGGNVFDGMMIYDALQKSDAKINIQVDGVAASIASTICMAGKVTMAKSAMMMVHKPYATTGGNADELSSTISALRQVEENMISAYCEKTSLPPEEIIRMMSAETWLSAEKCKALGFCDHVGSMGAINAAVDFSPFSNVPEEFKALFTASQSAMPSERELEQLLRDAGVSNSKAKAAVAAIKVDHRDDDGIRGGIEALLAKISAESLIAKMRN